MPVHRRRPVRSYTVAPETAATLSAISAVSKIPMGKILDRAVLEYVQHRSTAAEREAIKVALAALAKTKVDESKP